jgi:hypothetical protein
MLRVNISQVVATAAIILCGGLAGLIVGGAERNNIILWCGVLALIIGTIILAISLKRCRELGKLLKLEKEQQRQEQERELEQERQELGRQLERGQEDQGNPVVVVVYVNNPVSVAPDFLETYSV